MNCLKSLGTLAVLVVALLCAGARGSDDNQYEEPMRCIDQGVPSEIIVVVDRSFSISSSQFRLLQNFAKSLASRLLGGGGGGAQRMSVISYAEGATLACDLRQCTTAESVRRHVDLLSNRYQGGLTKTMDGLRLAREVLNKQRRLGTRAFVILFTDGVSNDGTQSASEKTALEASLLRQMPNLTLLAVGIGRDINRAELESVASGGAENVFAVDSFHQLDKQLIEQLFRKACVKASNPCEFNQRYADVVFVPMTQYLSPVNGRLVLQAARAFSQSAEVQRSGGRMRIGVVPRRCQLDVGYSLDTAPADVSRVTDERLSSSFLTAADYLRELADAYTPRADGATLTAKLAVLVVDHHLNRRLSQEVAAQARRVRSAGVTILVIGVGETYDRELAAELASEKRLLFEVGDYTDLFKIGHGGELQVHGSPFSHIFETISKESCWTKKPLSRG